MAWMDDLQLMSFSTVFQSYQDDGRLIMKGFVQLNPETARLAEKGKGKGFP